MVATRRRTACVGICGQSGCTSLATLISRQRLNAGIGSATARRLSTAKLASLPTIAGGCGARPRLADRSRSRSSCSTDSPRTASAGSRGGCTGSMRLEQGRCSPCCGLPARGGALPLGHRRGWLGSVLVRAISSASPAASRSASCRSVGRGRRRRRRRRATRPWLDERLCARSWHPYRGMGGRRDDSRRRAAPPECW